MKSNSVFLLFGAAVVLSSILLVRLFTSTPVEVKESIAKKIEASRAKSEAPPPVITPVAAPSPSASPTPTATPAVRSTPSPAAMNSPEIAPVVAQEFEAVRASALASIPSRGDLAKLKASETHFTPKTVIEAADQIGRLTELVEAHPELATKGLDFFRQCAENETAAESLRATCASEFKTLQMRSGLRATPPRLPERIAALVERLSS